MPVWRPSSLGVGKGRILIRNLIQNGTSAKCDQLSEGLSLADNWTELRQPLRAIAKFGLAPLINAYNSCLAGLVGSA
jgi:hypothetical protein